MWKKYRIIFRTTCGILKAYVGSENKEDAVRQLEPEGKNYFEFCSGKETIRVYRQNVAWIEIKELEEDEF